MCANLFEEMCLNMVFISYRSNNYILEGVTLCETMLVILF